MVSPQSMPLLCSLVTATASRSVHCHFGIVPVLVILHIISRSRSPHIVDQDVRDTVPTRNLGTRQDQLVRFLSIQ